MTPPNSAVHAIRLWWTRMGRHRFPRARPLVITADGGGSNGPRSRLWKWALQRLADDFDLTLSVCHFPPGTSKWNKIEHRLFSFISQNWRGKPLVSHQAVVNLIAATATQTGLRVTTALDTRRYDTAVQVPDEVFARLRVTPHAFHATGTTPSRRAIEPVVLRPRCKINRAAGPVASQPHRVLAQQHL
jgi:hypothetical protein